MNPMPAQTDLGQWQDDLEAALRWRGGPVLVRVYQETKSTQTIAKTFTPGPAVIAADQQTAGRGRLGRSWLSSPGAAVLMSLVYPGDARDPTHDRISMLAGVAVAEAVKALVPDTPVRLKWPNDVMVDGKKLAGILIDAVADAFVIGIGLNVLSARQSGPDLAGIATSLEELGRPMDRLAVIQAIASRLFGLLDSASVSEGLIAWRELAALGQTQTFEQAGQRITGEVVDLDPDHGLIVRRDSGEMITLPAATTSVVK